MTRSIAAEEAIAYHAVETRSISSGAAMCGSSERRRRSRRDGDVAICPAARVCHSISRTMEAIKQREITPMRRRPRSISSSPPGSRQIAPRYRSDDAVIRPRQSSCTTQERGRHRRSAARGPRRRLIKTGGNTPCDRDWNASWPSRTSPRAKFGALRPMLERKSIRSYGAQPIRAAARRRPRSASLMSSRS